MKQIQILLYVVIINISSMSHSAKAVLIVEGTHENKFFFKQKSSLS